MKKQIAYVSVLVLTFCFFKTKSFAQTENNQVVKNGPIYYSPGGTYSDWYFPNKESFSSLEWTFVPVADPPASLAKEGLLHYYAYNFGLENSSASVGRGYAGFQTNGIFKDIPEGKVINFSIWGSNGGKTNGLLNKGNTESGGVQIM